MREGTIIDSGGRTKGPDGHGHLSSRGLWGGRTEADDGRSVKQTNRPRFARRRWRTNRTTATGRGRRSANDVVVSFDGRKPLLIWT